MKISIIFSPIDRLGHYQEFTVCPSYNVYCTDPAYSNQFPTLKYESPIFQYLDGVMKLFSRSASMMESLTVERLSATKSSKLSLKTVLMVISLSLMIDVIKIIVNIKFEAI